MKVYQLKAEGVNAVCGGSGQCYSKRLFTSRKRVEAHVPKFKKACTTELSCLDLSCLQNNNLLQFKVLELKLGFWEFVRGCLGL